MTFAKSKIVSLTATTILSCCGVSWADLRISPRTETPPSKPAEILPGHSEMGEAFNEGPRQSARLMGGCGKIVFPITTTNKQAQQFFEQGIGQLHGFWYWESERSFRQAAMLDPKCAMSYWGMAMASFESDEKRAAGFIEKAVQNKKGTSRLETLWIDAVSEYLTSKSDAKDRRRQLVRAIENIIVEFPSDIEAKGMLAWLLWSNVRKGLPINSHLATDMLIAEVLKVNPMHPGGHHYRVHLWDEEKAERALSSAERIGESAPSIAHQWHMAGHIYSKLKKYPEATWQQEASSRVDHAYMIKDAIPPYQIHNYVHNQQWMVGNMLFQGRVREAIALSKNLIEIPRHPKLNAIANGGGAAASGRSRLWECLEQYELWEELLTLSDSVYLDATTDKNEQLKRYRARGLAYAHLNKTSGADMVIHALEEMLTKETSKETSPAKDAKQATAIQGPQTQVVKKTETKSKEAKGNPPKANEGKPIANGALRILPSKVAVVDKVKPEKKPTVEYQKKSEKKPVVGFPVQIERTIAEIKAELMIARGDKLKGYEALSKIEGINKLQLAMAAIAAGKFDVALDLAQKEVTARPQELLPLAMRVHAFQAAGKLKESQESFAELRKVGAFADLATPPLKRLRPVAQSLKLPDDWRDKSVVASSHPSHWPALESLGPLVWSPVKAPQFKLADSQGKLVDSASFIGRPVVLNFYLGAGCVHCVEQLQKFAPVADKFRAAGIELIAISTENCSQLKQSLIGNTKGPGSIPFPILSDEKLTAFKQYRAFDDYENKPLHATVFVDGEGFVRFSNVRHEPFTEVDFLLEECTRLLKINPRSAMEKGTDPRTTVMSPAAK